MPLPEDTAPGRAAQLVEELGRVVVASPRAEYSLRTDRRHLVRHGLLGGLVALWVGAALGTFLPGPGTEVGPVLGALVGGALWALRFPPGARAWVQVDRYTPEEEVGGTVAWVGVRERAGLATAVDDVVARVRDGSLDEAPEHRGLDRVRLRWRR